MHEVESALRSNEGYTLLLKGAPGAGKTTFAITLLEEMCTGDSKAPISPLVLTPSHCTDSSRAWKSEYR